MPTSPHRLLVPQREHRDRTPNSLGGYPASEQAEAYGLTSAYANGDTGVGQTIAAYELGLYDQADLATYFSCYGITRRSRR